MDGDSLTATGKSAPDARSYRDASELTGNPGGRSLVVQNTFTATPQRATPERAGAADMRHQRRQRTLQYEHARVRLVPYSPPEYSGYVSLGCNCQMLI
jgi:hypothetical protein